MKDYLKYFIFRYVLLYFVLSFICLFIMPTTAFIIMTILVVLFTYYLKRKNRLYPHQFQIQLTIILIILVCLTIVSLLSQGYLSSQLWNYYYILYFPFALFLLLCSLTAHYQLMIFGPILLLFIQLVSLYVFIQAQIPIKKYIVKILCLVLLCTTSFYVYQTSPARKYSGGHGFDYMNGYSSTDLSPFYPYSEDSQLVELQEPSTFTIENEEDMPVLDGAEACYPVYSAIAKAVYKDIDQIEKAYSESEDYNYYNTNGKIVTFTNTSVGYTRLINGNIDMFFGAKPSKSQLAEAKEAGVEFEYTPIGQEAFVFFVNKDNPVSNLSTQQIKDIYHGDITNWQKVGGLNKDILAFQRPERSGSQAMMTYFMGDIPLKEPLQYEYISGMSGIISDTAQYNGEKDAIGYTFRYFLEGLHQEEDVKILSVDGVEPTTENIKNQTYPISTYLYCVTLKSNQKENVKKLKDYLLSSQGQYIIEKTGYCALN